MFRAALTVLAPAVLVTGAAQAQEGRPAGPWFFGASAATAYQGPADLDRGPGDFSVFRVFGQASVGYALDRDTRVSLSLGYGLTAYDFGGGAGLGGGEPWQDIRDLRVSLPVFFSPAENVTALVIPSIRWNAETGADLGDGQTEGVLAGFSYRFSDSLSIGPGVGVFSEIDGDTSVFPILLVDWDITDNLNLSTGGGLAATQGPGLTLSYAVTDALSVGLSGRYESVAFALDDSGPAPGGIGEDESFPVAVSVAYDLSPTLRLSAFAGAEFGGSLTLLDARGDEIAGSDYDPAPIVGLALRARF